MPHTDPFGRNYAALSWQPSVRDKVKFRDYLKRTYNIRYFAKASDNVAIFGIAAGLGALLLMPLLGIMLGTMSGENVGGRWVGFFIQLVISVGFVWGLWALFRAMRNRGDNNPIRMFTFARDNGFGYTPATNNINYPGMIFNTGYDRVAFDRVHALPGQRYFDIGNFRFKFGNQYVNPGLSRAGSPAGRNELWSTWGYMVFQLDRRLPHIVLDAHANNKLGFSNLPYTPNSSQRLSLEGDFDRYFTLYGPVGYERDVLQILTPDVMALLIDNAASFDVEIIDDLMFIYSAATFVQGDRSPFVRMWQVMDTVGSQTARQTARYQDPRVPGPQPGPVPGYVPPAAAQPGPPPAPGFGLSAPGYPQPAQGYSQPTPGYPQPTQGYSQPAPGYSQPTQGYSQPAPGYSQPTQGYSQPAPGYSQPTQGYSQPTPGYPQPVAGYGQTAQGYGQSGAGNNQVAPAGRRLRGRTSIIAIVLGVIVIVPGVIRLFTLLAG
ncbi:hypothetical protein D9V34_07780 [Mycetocola lacteus]|uniref:Uncharacterized protein n=2 Tax=Mycetocola lacteus TaxID=76637 RepID=A0A3L7ASZ8_9MICO|nr:hypothetical protein D9V34_07780 [Mycetocola lacteus]